MRTSLNNIRETEAYLSGSMPPQERLLFGAKLLLDRELRENMDWQKKVYVLVQEYGRQKLKEELEEVHRKLFTEEKHSGFREKIMRLFNKK